MTGRDKLCRVPNFGAQAAGDEGLKVTSCRLTAVFHTPNTRPTNGTRHNSSLPFLFNGS
jgi:hypothetical protein